MTEQDRKELQDRFEKETGTTVINSQGEPDIDYVAWLENEVSKMHENMQYYMEYCQRNGYITPQDWIEKYKHF